MSYTLVANGYWISIPHSQGTVLMCFNFIFDSVEVRNIDLFRAFWRYISKCRLGGTCPLAMALYALFRYGSLIINVNF